MFCIGALDPNIDPLGNAVVAAKKLNDLSRSKRSNRIYIVRKNMFARTEVCVARAIQANKIAV